MPVDDDSMPQTVGRPQRVYVVKALATIPETSAISVAYLLSVEAALHKMWREDFERYWSCCREMFYCAVVHPGPAVSHWVHDRSPVVVAMNGWGGTAPLPEASAADIDILVTSDIAVDKDVVKKDVSSAVVDARAPTWRGSRSRRARPTSP